MYTLTELSSQYGRLSRNLYRRMRVIRAEAAREEDPSEAYLLRRQADMLREMWRETRDTSQLLAHYYDGVPRCGGDDESPAQES